MSRTLWCVAIFGLIGCQDQGPICAPVPPHLIGVQVNDLESGAPITGAKLVARSGAYIDSAVPGFNAALDATFLEAGGVAGTYDVTVSHPDYEDWFRSGVSVPVGVCGPRRVTLTALLRAKGA